MSRSCQLRLAPARPGAGSDRAPHEVMGVGCPNLDGEEGARTMCARHMDDFAGPGARGRHWAVHARGSLAEHLVLPAHHFGVPLTRDSILHLAETIESLLDRLLGHE